MKPDEIYNEEYEEKQREADEQLKKCDPFIEYEGAHFEDYDYEDDEDQTPDCWGCASCGKLFERRPMGGPCDGCYGMTEEQYF